jgi:hypothetical protein
MTAMAPTGFLTAAALEQALHELALKARSAGKIIELAIYGGSALVLTLPERPATKDVDAVVQHDSAWVRQAVAAIAEEKDWPPNWLNDGVKGWLSSRDAEARHLFRTYPSEDEPGLRVFVASPSYLFAMKCLAMRIGGADESQDRRDIEALARMIGVATAEQALSVVSSYYPHSQISPKTQYGIEEIFARPAETDRGSDKP